MLRFRSASAVALLLGARALSAGASAAASAGAPDADEDYRRQLTMVISEFPLCATFGWSAITCKDYIDETIMSVFTGPHKFVRSHIATMGSSTRPTEHDWYDVIAIPMDSDDSVLGRDGDGMIYSSYMWSGCGTTGKTALSMAGDSDRTRSSSLGPFNCAGKTGFDCCSDIKGEVSATGHHKSVHCFLDYAHDGCTPNTMLEATAPKVIIYANGDEDVPGTPQLNDEGKTLTQIINLGAYWSPPSIACEDDPTFTVRVGRLRFITPPKYEDCDWVAEKTERRCHRYGPRTGETDPLRRNRKVRRYANDACAATCQKRKMTMDGYAGCA